MSRLAIKLWVALLAVGFPVSSLASTAELPWVPGEVLVAVAGDSPLRVSAAGEVSSTEPTLAEILLRHGLTRSAPLAPRTAAERAGGNRFLKLISGRADFDAAVAARELRQSGAVRAATPNHLLRFFVMPNDPRLNEQWHIESGGAADISLPAAWDLEQGDVNVVIAIMDTGVDTGHPDMAARIWQNPGEIAGNGIDDDGNGYVDDWRGWDFGQNDNDPNPHATPDPTGIDVGFHGTHCAGIAGAATNNGVGVAGATWGCRIMPLKVVDSSGAFTTGALTGAFLYAADMTPDVVSMSFGGPDQDGFAAFVQALVDEANAAGVICVAAAGNDGTSTPLYPAACGGVIAVAATNASNARASFSSWGDWVDVAAPGEHILSTMCRNYSFGFLMELLYTLLLGWDGTPYLYSDGTSMACPLVAGVCGLIRSRAPELSPDEVLELLIESGDAVAYDHPIGVKVNAASALERLTLSAAETAPPATLRLVGSHPNPFNPRTTLRFSLPEATSARLTVHDAAGRSVRVLVAESLAPGAHAVDWDGRDDAGRRVASGVYWARLEAGEVRVAHKMVLVK